jgi:adenosylcobinamide-GDP ribazoletransferase
VRNPVRQLAHELGTGLGLMTRLPVGWLIRKELPYAPDRAAWSFPAAGLLVGAVGALVLLAAVRLGMPPLLASCWVLAAQVWLTAGLHEDGLADTADGFGGGRDRERRLLIMRDSRIGSFGALALLLSGAIRLSAVATLATHPPGRATLALLAAGLLSRAGSLPPLLLLPSARRDGLGHAFAPGTRGPVLLGLAAALAGVFLLLPPPLAVMADAGMLGTSLAVTVLARRKIGGHTGDVAGAAILCAECVVLSVLASA